MDLLIGAGGHIQEETHGDITLNLVATVKEVGVRGSAGGSLDDPFDHGVEVDSSPSGRCLILRKSSGRSNSNCLRVFLHERGVLAESLVVEIDLPAWECALLQAAPTGLVVIRAKVPFIVKEGLWVVGGWGVTGVLAGGIVALECCPGVIGGNAGTGHLLHQIVHHGGDRAVEIAVVVLGELEFRALLDEFLELLGGDGTDSPSSVPSPRIWSSIWTSSGLKSPRKSTGSGL